MNNALMQYNPTPIEPAWVAQQRAAQMQGAQRNALMQQMQMEDAMQQSKLQREQQNALMQFRQSMPSPQFQASQQALAGGGGPTVANAARMPEVDPRLQALHGAMRAGAISPMDYLKEANPAPKFTTVAPGASLVNERTGKPMFTAPIEPKASDVPSAVREYEYAKQQGFQGSFEQWTTSQKKAGATSVSVNTGQKGLDNTLKLRGDFRSEPVYKAHQEMQSAYSQIQQALKQKTPAGDLAGATKIMKLLDPGSVVRESELGMAMAASGLMDRVTSYANRIMTGEKLTPQQRTDFQALADALYSESVNQYNTKRGEYQGIAERNNLPVADVLGSASAAPAASGGWSIKPKGK